MRVILVTLISLTPICLFERVNRNLQPIVGQFDKVKLNFFETLCRFFGITINIMKNIVIIREGRILLEEAVEQENRLALKICVGTQIYKYSNQLVWSEPCHRWETTSEIKLQNPHGSPIQLELLYPARKIPKVIGEATLDLAIFKDRFEEEIKIALTFDGMIKGWLYCQIEMEGTHYKEKQIKFLYIHKIAFFFLEEYADQLQIQLFQNMEPIFKKKFYLNQKSKTLFPNLKNNIKYSDVIHLSIWTPSQQLRTISFLIDNIKRGKTAYYETWIRNKYNNKVGDIKIEYFLENLFLQNQRKVMRQQAIYPKTFSKMSTLLSDIAERRTDCASKTGGTDSVGKTEERLSDIIETPKSRSPQCTKNTAMIQKILNLKKKTPQDIPQQSHSENKGQNDENNKPYFKMGLKKVSSKRVFKASTSFYFENPLE